MIKPLRIGTRGSKLALWQANKVKDLLEESGVSSELVIIQSTGDKNRKAKLHEMGLVGVFTKELDDSLLLEEIDIAVHSLKDVPTSPPMGIVQCAVLERADPFDVIIPAGLDASKSLTVATGSLRRQAFWKSKFPEHKLSDLRGNVPTRLEKVASNEIDGVILAKAGLDRLELTPENSETLEWMTPAPAQGIVGIFCLDKSQSVKDSLGKINHKNTEICAQVERDILKTLEGGCTAPIGAYAQIIKRSVQVKASLLSTDGKNHVYHEDKMSIIKKDILGESVANHILENGGKAIMNALKSEDNFAPESSESVKDIEVSDTNNTSSPPRVLCLKKLTPPRIKLGLNYGLDLDQKEVIQTLPEFDSYHIAQALKSTNNWIFSSLNSVSAITKVLKGTSMIHKHVFCVGSRVANFFDGKVKAIHQVNSVSELTETAKASGKKEFVWFHGNKSDLALVDDFEVHEMAITPHSVYKTEMTEPRIEDLEAYQVYCFFSPSGVESFNAHNYIPENAIVAAIGSTTASYIHEVYEDQENTKLENIIQPKTFEFEHLLAALKGHIHTYGTN